LGKYLDVISAVVDALGLTDAGLVKLDRLGRLDVAGGRFIVTKTGHAARNRLNADADADAASNDVSDLP
jgi:hypothetical protein